MNQNIPFPERSLVVPISAKHQIEVKDLKSITGSFDKKIFMINQTVLLRVSETSMTQEQEKFERVATLKNVPKIIHTGTHQWEDGAVNYTILTLLLGGDFVNAFSETTAAQQGQLGHDVAEFLDHLHKIHGTCYDTGLYVPAIPNFSGTWRAGHQIYWEQLKQQAEQIPLEPDSLQTFEDAFAFLRASSAALDFQSGPKLLHNDFHPRNILLDQGKFSGVIDWECSQYGEADFELCHLVHWCLYPPKPDINFQTFLRALFKASPQYTQVPHLAQRLTIYQIEHEIQQILWSAGEAESWRSPRLIRWMAGGVDDLFREIAA